MVSYSYQRISCIISVTNNNLFNSSYTPGYVGPCFLIQCEGTRVLLDIGEGCTSRLLQAGVDPCSIDTLFVSHIHHDHWAGISSLAIARVAEKCGGLRLWIPWHNGVELVTRMMPRNLDYQMYKGKALELCRGTTLQLWSVEHTVETYGLILYRNSQPIIAYTADTAFSQQSAEAIKGVWVLLGEATLPSELGEIARKEKHMTVQELLDLTDLVGAKVLVPVHLSPYSLRELRGRMESVPFTVYLGEDFWINV
jgi:ribonuclease Z